jgi:hypothetical protein
MLPRGESFPQVSRKWSDETRVFTNVVDQWWRSYDWWLSLLGARPRLQPAVEPTREPRPAPEAAPAEVESPARRDTAPAEPEPQPAPELSYVVATPSPAGEDSPMLGLDALLEAEDVEAEDDEDEDVPADIPVVPDEVLEAQLRDARAAARVEALAGPHRVLLSMPAGPGSLPEALKFLEEAGHVQSTFVEDEELGPHLLYTPAAEAS